MQEMKSAYVENRENVVHAKQEEFIMDYIHETRLSELKNTEDVLESFYPFAKKEKIPEGVITDSIDAYYGNGTLYFKSYYLANQILNLNKYYRQATDEDIRTFCQSSCFYVNDLDSLVSASNNWTRKKIAYILDTKVLETNSIDFILQDSKEFGLQFQTNGENKIIFPEDFKVQKELLSYLADEIYRGRLTDDVYLTNSQRALK